MLKISMVLGLLLVVSGCVYSESNIQNEINNANYCETSDDCEFAGSKCPFGCSVYVNKGEIDRISSLIESYDSKCAYVCLKEEGVECMENKCQTIYENIDEVIYCDKESISDVCIALYDPVCGYFDPEKILCVKEPCAQTYSNSCYACGSGNVEYYVPGECPS